MINSESEKGGGGGGESREKRKYHVLPIGTAASSVRF